MSHKNRRPLGFTLIELLVVITIIAILAAILFPVFARARAKARTATCLSNVKQITLAVIQYTSDNDSKYPLGANGPTIWRATVQPYMRNAQLFLCPSRREQPPDSCAYGWSWAAIDAQAWDYMAGYSLNTYVSWPGSQSWGDEGVQDAAKMALILENACGSAGQYDDTIPIASGGVSELGNIVGAPEAVALTIPCSRTCFGMYFVEAAEAHGMGSNVGYADGHAKWRAYGDFSRMRAASQLGLAAGVTACFAGSDYYDAYYFWGLNMGAITLPAGTPLAFPAPC